MIMYILRIPCFSYNLLFYLKARFSPTLSERPIMTLSSNCCQCASSLKVKNDNVYVYKCTLCINDNKRSLLITYAPTLVHTLWSAHAFIMGSIHYEQYHGNGIDLESSPGIILDKYDVS